MRERGGREGGERERDEEGERDTPIDGDSPRVKHPPTRQLSTRKN